MVDALAVGLAHFDTLERGEQDLRGPAGHCVREAVKEDFGAAEETAEVEVLARREDLVELAEGEGREDLGVEGVELGSELEALGMGALTRDMERGGGGAVPVNPTLPSRKWRRDTAALRRRRRTGASQR